MNKTSKTIAVVVLIGALAGGAYMLKENNNSNLLKGQLLDGQNESTTKISAKPDLEAGLKIILPQDAEGDIKAEVTVKNVGDIAIDGGTPFVNKIKINDKEVFANSDTYSEIAPGDSFSFQYPISKSIYKYPKTGTVSVMLDTENAIKESNESNNIVKKEYMLP